MNIIDKIIEDVIVREGGYVDNPNDRGGKTKYGITEAVARQYDGYLGHMRDLPVETARRIYKNRYVKAPSYDLIADVSEPIAAELIDTYINMGAGNRGTLDGPSYWLQRLLNAFNKGSMLYPDLTVDGNVGPNTILALRKFLSHRPEGEQVLVVALNCLQGARYLRIIEANPSQEAFAYGWFKNRIL